MPTFQLPNGTTKDFATVEEARAYRATNFPSQLQSPQQKRIDPRVASEANRAYEFPAGSNERTRQGTFAKTVADITGANTPKDLPSDELEKILQVQKVQDRLKDLIKFKSTGFGGKGIDTGPLVGGKIPLPFTDADPNIVPASASQFFSELAGNDEGSADRGLLRQKIVSVLGPKQKEQTGAQAALRELLELIYPQVPREGDQDKLFYEKAFEGITRGQQDLQNRIAGLRSSNIDVSGLRDIEGKNPDDVINGIIQELSTGPQGEFSLGKVDPERITRALGSSGGGLAPEKQSRLEELRRKRAEGTLR